MSLENFPRFLLNFSEDDVHSESGHFYEFKSFRLDLAERQLLNDVTPIPLTPKAFDVLTLLVENAGHLVQKETLMQTVWPDSVVEEANISRVVHTLRKVLGEDENGNKFIETVAKRGYRFVAPVNEVHEPLTQKLSPADDRAAPIGLTSSPVDAPLSPTATAETIVPIVTNSKAPPRLVLFSMGFVSAITLIALLSFNFMRASSGAPNPRLAKRGTANEEAYRLYLQGATLAEKRGRDDTHKAIEDFEQAIKLDPNYALAYAGLANAHNALAINGGGGNTTEEYLKAKDAVEKALAIDDGLAEAHSYFGEIKSNFEWDFAGAEREHKRAIALDPNSSAAHRMYALLLGILGRADESIAEAKIAIDLEPASALNQKLYGRILFWARRYDEVITQMERAIELDPHDPTNYPYLVGAYQMKGDDDRAFEWMVRSMTAREDSADEISTTKMIYARSGWRGLSERRLESAKADEKNGKPNFLELARVSADLGLDEQAIDYLEKAIGDRKWGLVTLVVSPRFDHLRSNPRFDALLKRIGLK